MNARAPAPAETDASLICRALEGDRPALDRLVREHVEVAFRVAVGIVRDDDLAQDVVQEACVKMVRALGSFRGDAAFRSWFLSIVSNEAKSALRTGVRRRESALDDVPEVHARGPGIERTVVARTEGERVRAFVARLPEKQRLAVELRIDEGLGFREIGEVIGSSEGAARVNYHHGVKKLREWLREDA